MIVGGSLRATEGCPFCGAAVPGGCKNGWNVWADRESFGETCCVVIGVLFGGGNNGFN